MSRSRSLSPAVAAAAVALLFALLTAPAGAADRERGAPSERERAGAADRRGARGAPADLLLTLRERPGLHRFVRAVSDPASRRYRRYASIPQLARRYGAPPRARRAVVAWARSSGLRVQIGPSGTFALVSGDAGAVASAAGLASPAAAAARVGARRTAAAVPVPAPLRGIADHAALLSPRELPVAGDAASATAGSPAAGHATGAPRAAADAAGAIAAAPLAGAAQAPQPQLPSADALLARAFQSAAERTGTARGCAAGANAGLRQAIRTAQGDVPFALLGYTPNQYATAYGHAEMHSRGFRGEGMRVAVLEIDGFKRRDLDVFASCFGASVPQITKRRAGIARFPAPGEETTLDLQVLTAAAPRLEAIDAVFSDATVASLLKGAVATLGHPGRRPDVISISLGICEPSLAGEVPTARAMEDVFAVAAGAGISTLVSTGDNGVTGCEEELGPSMIPAVAAPSTFPSVTAVGGTNVTLDAANRLVSQRVWNSSPGQIAGGGGGLSVVFDAPWYQGGPGAGGPGGRAVPDVSALGDPYPGFAIHCTARDRSCRDLNPAGGWQTIGGTSAATPLTAAGVVLAAQEARRAGQPPLGLLNPLIYAIGGGGGRTASRALSDVRIGSNDVGAAVPREAGGGQPLGQYQAGRGYDLASGWGSLKVAGFSRAALAAARRRGLGR